VRVQKCTQGFRVLGGYQEEGNAIPELRMTGGHYRPRAYFLIIESEDDIQFRPYFQRKVHFHITSA
jgi:hypothetical protein